MPSTYEGTLRVDDIPFLRNRMIYTPYGVIGKRGCTKLLNYLTKYKIILSKGVIL